METPIRDEKQKSPAPLVECSSCHQKVSPFRIVRLGGRELCPSCAGMWFDSDED